MSINDFLFLLLGVTFGFSASAGLFALITSITVVPRMADETYTKKHIKTYETAITVGGTMWNIFFLLDLPYTKYIHPELLHIIIIAFGLFSGIYIGCVAMALAERLSVTAILSRRLRLHIALPFTISVMALGKLIGELIFFMYGF